MFNIILENLVVLLLIYVIYLLLIVDWNFNIYVLVVVINDIFIREDQEFFICNEVFFVECICVIEIGGCLYVVICEDIFVNMGVFEKLQVEFDIEMLFVESGGDNFVGKFDIQVID